MDGQMTKRYKDFLAQVRESVDKDLEVFAEEFARGPGEEMNKARMEIKRKEMEMEREEKEATYAAWNKFAACKGIDATCVAFLTQVAEEQGKQELLKTILSDWGYASDKGKPTGIFFPDLAVPSSCISPFPVLLKSVIFSSAFMSPMMNDWVIRPTERKILQARLQEMLRDRVDYNLGKLGSKIKKIMAYLLGEKEYKRHKATSATMPDEVTKTKQK